MPGSLSGSLAPGSGSIQSIFFQSGGTGHRAGPLDSVAVPCVACDSHTCGGSCRDLAAGSIDLRRGHVGQVCEKSLKHPIDAIQSTGAR